MILLDGILPRLESEDPYYLDSNTDCLLQTVLSKHKDIFRILDMADIKNDKVVHIGEIEHT